MKCRFLQLFFPCTVRWTHFIFIEAVFPGRETGMYPHFHFRHLKSLDINRYGQFSGIILKSINNRTYARIKLSQNGHYLLTKSGQKIHLLRQHTVVKCWSILNKYLSQNRTWTADDKPTKLKSRTQIFEWFRQFISFMKYRQNFKILKNSSHKRFCIRFT